MKKIFTFIAVTMFCVTSFAETAQLDSKAAEETLIEMSAEMSLEVPTELAVECESAGPNDDGYIYKGMITLTRVVSGIRESFYLYDKGGVKYVSSRKDGPFYRLQSWMTINGIDYKY